MQNVNGQFMISLLIIALGYISKRFGLVSEKDGDGLTKVIMNITLPAVVINTFSSVKIDISLITLPLISAVYGLLMGLLAIFIFRKEDKSKRGMLSMVLPGLNIGLFAYPLVEGIWGEKGLTYFAMFDMGNALIVFGVCYLLANYFTSDEASVDVRSMLNRVARSVPLIAYMITLAVNLTGLHFPGVIVDISKVLSRANMPLSLLALGIYLSFSLDAGYWKGISKVLGIRYLAGITTGILLYFIMPFDNLFRYTVLIGPVLPIALVVLPYSVQFKYDKRFVGTLINITIVISFLLVWLIFGIISAV